MYQRETKQRFSQLMHQFGLWEMQIATHRNLLASLDEFEPYCAFNRIAKNKVIRPEELDLFLSANGIQVPHESLLRLIESYAQNQWQYGDFLRVVLPNDNQNLRGKIVSKNPGVLDPDERLSADIESGMCQLFMKELEAMKSLEHLKIMLMKCADYSPEQAFLKIDLNGDNLLDLVALCTYLETYTQIDEVTLDYTIRYLDRDGDGIVQFTDFCNALYPQERFAKTKITQSRAKIVSNLINLNKTSSITQGKSPVQSKITNGTYDSLNIHKEICYILKEMITAEKILELQRQDLYLCMDFSPQLLFQMLDTNESGLIDYAQFDQWLNGLQIFPDAQQVILFFERYDTNKDGYLMYEDFLRALQPQQKEYQNISQGRKINLMKQKTLECVKKLFELILQCESTIEATKINLFQTCQIDRQQQFQWLNIDGVVNVKALKSATKMIGLQISEKDIWFLQARIGSSLSESDFFDQLQPKTSDRF